MPRYAGEYRDGFGNRITVHAVSNPTAVNIEPTAINHRAPGYGIVEFDRTSRRITIANWPRWVDASKPGAEPYAGWPITIEQSDNGYPDSGWVLEKLESDIADPVVQVIDETRGETVYTLRVQGTTFVPQVRRPGAYTVKIFDPDQDYEQIRKGVRAQRRP